MLSYRLLFDKKNLARQLIKVPNKYAKLLAKILKLKSDKVIEILVDSYFVDKYGVKLYGSELVIPGPLLQKERKGDFIRYMSNIRKKLISGDKMSKYHSEEVLLVAKQGQGLFSDEIKKKFGTIFTPDFVVDKCIDLVWKYYKGDRLEAAYCDPACGDGNFLIALYDHLMKEENDLSSPLKSKHIIEHCLWGFDIIEGMVDAAKIALFDRHCQTCGDDFIPIESFNVYWGNTICLPADTEQAWYNERNEHEGGMLDEHLRDKKFDVVVGNPPYTHLRNLDNRRYAAYPKQRDMAQVFVRWALDHLTEDGVIGYNIDDVWLNVKVNDGSLETRKCLSSKMVNIVDSEDINDYSEGGGGDKKTIILTLSNGIGIYFNGVECSGLLNSGFLNKVRNPAKYEFVETSISDYSGRLSGCSSGHRTGTNSSWNNIIFNSGNTSYLLVKRHISYSSKRGIASYQGQFKYACVSCIKELVKNVGESEVKYSEFGDEQKCKWCWAYLNTALSFKYVGTFTKTKSGEDKGYGGDAYSFSNSLWPNLMVPDFDYYKQNHPKRFESYMEWIEQNMHDKDKFLAGIDAEFEKLING